VPLCQPGTHIVSQPQCLTLIAYPFIPRIEVCQCDSRILCDLLAAISITHLIEPVAVARHAILDGVGVAMPLPFVVLVVVGFGFTHYNTHADVLVHPQAAVFRVNLRVLCVQLVGGDAVCARESLARIARLDLVEAVAGAHDSWPR
jgi:hypothetical protein